MSVGQSLRMITREEDGDVAPRRRRSIDASDSSDATDAVEVEMVGVEETAAPVPEIETGVPVGSLAPAGY
jgi:hypothetical protein